MYIKSTLWIGILILFLSLSSYQPNALPVSTTSLTLNEVKFLIPAPIVIDGILSPNEWDGVENVTK